jgi:predicted RNA-binding protein
MAVVMVVPNSMVVTTIQPSVASMEAIVKNSMRNILTAMSQIHFGLELAIVMVVTTIQQRVASMEAIVISSISIPTAVPQIIYHLGLEMENVMVTTILPSADSMMAIVATLTLFLCGRLLEV